MEFSEIGTPFDELESRVDPPRKRVTSSPWHSCLNASELAEAIHKRHSKIS